MTHQHRLPNGLVALDAGLTGRTGRWSLVALVALVALLVAGRTTGYLPSLYLPQVVL
jgi:hypothetical protein